MKQIKMAVVALGVLGAVNAVRADDKPWTVFYLDANCFQVKYENSEWTDELIQKSVDSYIHGAVTHMFVNPNGMRAWYPSKVMEDGTNVVAFVGNGKARPNYCELHVTTATCAANEK